MEIKIILGMVIHSQIRKCHRFSLEKGSEILIFRCEYMSWGDCRKQRSKRKHCQIPLMAIEMKLVSAGNDTG